MDYGEPRGYQTLPLESAAGNRRHRRVRDSATGPVGKDYDSADETLISRSLPSPSTHFDLQNQPSIPNGRPRHPRHISDPGFVQRESQRPPISDNIQLSRRSRQFNYWNHFYPRNFSDPAVVVRPDLENSASSDVNDLTRPPVFTSIEEFQKHYGSCYSRTMPQKKRSTVRFTTRPSSAPSSPQMKRVKFAPVDVDVEDSVESPSDVMFNTFPGRRREYPTCQPTFNSLPGRSNKKSSAGPADSEFGCGNAYFSEPESDFRREPDALTSSLTVKLDVSKSSKADKKDNVHQLRLIRDENRRNVETKDDDLDVLILQNAVASDVGARIRELASGLRGSRASSANEAMSKDFALQNNAIGMTTAKLELMQRDLPKAQSPILTLLKKNRDVETQREVSKPTTNITVKSVVRKSQPVIDGIASRRVATDIQPDTFPSYPAGRKDNRYNYISGSSKSLPYLASDQILTDQSDSEMSQKDWYKQVYKTLHKLEPEDLSSYSLDRSDIIIPPRPKISPKTDGGESYGRRGDSVAMENHRVVENAPCGVQYISRPGRSDRNLQPTVAHKSNPSHQRPNFASPKALEGTRVYHVLENFRQKDPGLCSDEYWLQLAGLSENRDQQPTVGQLKLPGDKVAENILQPVKAKAIYGFRAKTEKELSFNQDDTILLLRPIDKNWFEAKLNGVVGLVPRSYVKVSEEIESEQEKEIIRVVAKHDFTAKFPTELSFSKGDVLTVLRRIDGNWYEGSLNHRTGIFPINYVELLITPDATSSLQRVAVSTESPSSPSGYVRPSTATQPGPRSPYNSYISDDANSGLNRDVIEFDRLFEYCQNLNKSAGDNVTLQSKVRAEDRLAHAPSKTTDGNAIDSGKYCTISVSSSIKEGSTAYDRNQNQNSIQQTTPSTSDRNPSANRSATPSLHLLYEEPWYQVLYDYSPQHDDELDLHEGDLIYLLERCDDGWCVGRSDRSKRVGTFPSNYVTRLG